MYIRRTKMTKKLFIAGILILMLLISCKSNKGVKKMAEKEQNKEKLSLEEVEKTVIKGDEVVKITMESGEEIYFIFYPEKAPLTCKNFIYLTEKGFYNGLKFHRVIADFVVQGGDPEGTGAGGPGYSIKAEFNDLYHEIGTVAMARSQEPNSAGSQFYICLSKLTNLDNKYTIFGQVVKGTEIFQGIQQGDVMKKVEIIHNSTYYNK
jgi:peptidylprolyl isomerase/peptidyl-prolyl cis-trans isomerase B (cyclophilin B)